jgi:hypothetical protein
MNTHFRISSTKTGLFRISSFCSDTTMHTHTHTINVNKTCALHQTTGKTGTKHRLCEIDVNITNGVIFFTHHEQYYIDIHVRGVTTK